MECENHNCAFCLVSGNECCASLEEYESCEDQYVNNDVPDSGEEVKD